MLLPRIVSKFCVETPGVRDYCDSYTEALEVYLKQPGICKRRFVQVTVSTTDAMNIGVALGDVLDMHSWESTSLNSETGQYHSFTIRQGGPPGAQL
jgi:hypothetical protein